VDDSPSVHDGSALIPNLVVQASAVDVAHLKGIPLEHKLVR
jgi:hypothetical protein